MANELRPSPLAMFDRIERLYSFLGSTAEPEQDTTAQANTESMTDDDNDDQEPDKTAIFLPPNTFADEFADFVPLIRDRFNASVEFRQIDDRPFERNLHRIVEGSHQLEREIERELLELSDRANFAYVVSSMGTGYILWKLSDTQFAFGNTIDLVTASHKTSPENLTAEPRNTIVTGVGAAVMEPPVVLTDHLVGKEPFDRVLPKFAQLTGALLETDPGNRNFGYWALGYRTIPIGGQADMDLVPSIQRAVGQEAINVSTDQWAPWSPSQEVQFAGRANPFCIVPPDCELGLQDVEVVHADVVNAHVLKLRPLDPTWVNEEIRRGGMAYVDERIRDESSLVHQVFRSHCKKFGKADPVAAWEELRENHLDDHLPEQ